MQNKLLGVRMENKLYHFDKVTILFCFGTEFIEERVNMEKIKTTCKDVKLKPTFGKVNIRGYKSRLVLIVPTIQTFELLQELEQSLKEIVDESSL
jgi:uncharacterized protein (DUF2225 family)